MSLSATGAAQLLLETAESGGRGAAAVVVDSTDDRFLGSRLVLLSSGGELRTTGGLGSDELDAAARELLEAALGDPRSRDGLRVVETPAGRTELYVEVRRALRDLVVVGAGHVAQPIAHLGALLGYRVTVLDDRPDFATRERFPDAYSLLKADFSDPFASVEIHERTHLLLVTRGHKYDYECLRRAVRHDPQPAYVGMIGSRRRVRATYAQLLEEGIDPSWLERIHAPVGLDIGAETPEEIAVAVAAELVLLDRGGTGAPLRSVERVQQRFFPRNAGAQHTSQGRRPSEEEQAS